MSADFQELDDWLKALLLRLDPAERRKVNRRVSYDLRRSQRERISAQRNPDGTPYVPRKSNSKNLRSKKGAIKRRAMFAKIRTQKHLKVRSTADEVAVGFRGRTASIASTHQKGRVHTTALGQRFVTPKRELLGTTNSDHEMLIDSYLNYLALKQ